ncbi:Nitrogen assimilation sensor kinase [gamma proteobacterium HdN1]|nr:Nitrogen assimilation sensor kinase [gamma proteobacterium HdN1]
MLGNLSTAVLLLDEQLQIEYANPAAEQLFATSLSHLQEQFATLFLRPDNNSAEDLKNALHEMHPYTRREAPIQVAGLTHGLFVDYIATPILNEETGEKQLLVELLPLDRMRRISREEGLLTVNHATKALVRGMAHEIKNPLGGIRGAAQLLERSFPSPEIKEYTDVIISETDRLGNLLDRMLGPTRMLDFRCINVHRVLERVRMILQAEILQTKTALIIERDYDPSLPEVWADMDQLIQVVLNVARNAAQSLLENPMPVQAGDAAPRIIMRTRALRQFAIGAQRHRLVCQVEIEDNGHGIRENLRETLFYPMVTGRAQGTGLGLPIAQAIMQKHGGLIECDSIPGRTVFRILIPIGPCPIP